MNLTAKTLTVATSVLLTLAFAGPAAAEDCPTPPQSDVALGRLYVYSQHAQAAYGETPSNACQVPQLHQAAAEALARTTTAPLAEAEYQVDFPAGPGSPQVAVYEGETSGVYFATCRRDDTVPGLALSIFRTETPGEPGEQGFWYRLRRVFQRPVAAVLTEELLLTASHQSGNGTPARLFAVRGTELAWQRILPNLLHLLNDTNSCVFDMAAQIVALAEDNWPGPVLVAGHSLGGSVAQYVAQNRVLRNSQDPDPFTAYSFNGVGLAAPVPHLPGLYSYQIAGEFVAQSEPWFSKQQGGNVIRYFPSRNDWPIASSDWPPIIRPYELARKRHELSVVQDSLCECAQGRGRVEYDESQP